MKDDTHVVVIPPLHAGGNQQKPSRLPPLKKIDVEALSEKLAKFMQDGKAGAFEENPDFPSLSSGMRTRTEKENLMERGQAMAMGMTETQLSMEMMGVRRCGVERGWEAQPASLQFSEVLRGGRTGDVLLFKNNDCLNTCMRGLLCMRYNHVAVLIKVQGEPLGVCETLGNTGVSVFRFSDFYVQRWFRQYHVMAIRKLAFETDRDYDAFNTKVQLWLDEIVQRPYRWTPRMFCRACVSSSSMEEDRAKKAFFCSELVAATFKAGGVLPEHEPTVTFGPKSFQDQMLMDMVLDGKLAILGPEVPIVFPDS